MKVLVVFYSMYGHIYQMAQAAVKGGHEVPGAEVPRGAFFQIGLFFVRLQRAGERVSASGEAE
jgi:hypothetical protein